MKNEEKNCLLLKNRFDFLKQKQHFFVAQNSEEERKRKRKKKIQSTTFRNMCNITKHIEKLTSAT